MINVEQHLEARMNRRTATENRYLDRLESRTKQAEPLIGELVRDGNTIFYINVLSKEGRSTGKTREFQSHSEAVDYLIRNKYV